MSLSIFRCLHTLGQVSTQADAIRYDNFPGSSGLSPALFDLEKELLRHCLKTINICPCKEGCPSCVGPSRETGRQAKQVAQEILRGLLEE
jgi:DEAD/DEAH box helicase domain-containing protein